MYLKTSARVSSQCIIPRLGVVVENSHLSSKPYYRGKPDATRQSLDHLKLPEPELPNRFVLIKACSIACGKVGQALGDVRLLHSTLAEEHILIVTVTGNTAKTSVSSYDCYPLHLLPLVVRLQGRTA